MFGNKQVLFVSVLTLVMAVTQVSAGKNWALLVASANGFYNYDMQADVLHAYHVFKEGGIPDEQIIVMMYDDIATLALNPFKGKVFHSYDMKDVYRGVPKDYTGKMNRKDVFLAILRGDKAAVKKLTGKDGKIVDSGPDDNVFVYISDHGGPGCVAWWDGTVLSAKELNTTITYLHSHNRYKNLAFYIDTCFSGSMFENILPSNIGVYAVTAANKTHMSYSADCESEYFPDEARICLGGLFSINWIYQTESDDRRHTTMNQQFREASIACNGMSTPKQYGDLSIAKRVQKEFLGDSAKKRGGSPNNPPDTILHRSRRSASAESVIPRHTMAYHLLKNRLVGLPATSEHHYLVSQELREVERLMKQADDFIVDIQARGSSRVPRENAYSSSRNEFEIINWNCYEPVLETFHAECPGAVRREEVRYYVMSHFSVLINMCSEMSTANVLEALRGAARGTSLCQV